MNVQPVFLRLFNFFARVLGVMWILAGLVALCCAIVFPAQRGINLGIGLFVLLAAIGFLVAKPVTSDNFESIAGCAQKRKEN